MIAAQGRRPLAVVFDLGGVVFDWRPRAVVAAALPARVATEHDAAHWAREIFQGYGGDWQHFDRGTVEPDELVLRIARRSGLHEHEVRAVIDAVPHALKPLPQTVELLRGLAVAGTRLHYLSNMPAPYARHLVETHADVFALFDGGVFSSHVKIVKPEPALFEHALARIGAAPHECVLLDDHAPNVEAARALGWQAVLFTDAAQAADALRRLGV